MKNVSSRCCCTWLLLLLVVVTDDNIASNVDVEEKKISNIDAAEDHKSEKKVEKSDKNETGLIEVKSPMEEDMEGDDESANVFGTSKW